MDKIEAVACLGQESLLRPSLLRAALKANDRLKLYLTLLQAAAQHAQAPDHAPVDLSREIAAADIQPRSEVEWLRQLPGSATMQSGAVHVPDLPHLMQRLSLDLGIMARPLLDPAGEASDWQTRLDHWQAELGQRTEDHLDQDMLRRLTHGRRGQDDSLHLTVMDLHKALNRLAASLAGESVEGAHAWQLAADGSDVPLLRAFMKGLNRTRHLKLDHPGLDTAATRDGQRLLIQNDIGTNDAHVLVLQVEETTVTLTYSDLHRQRFTFFQAMLADAGAQWSGLESRRSAQLNSGGAYHVGVATFTTRGGEALCECLEAIGARIVFLIDWNRARKRLLPFVSKSVAVDVLREAARREVGHMAWLHCGGDRLVWSAMAAQDATEFRLGDRLDDVMGSEAARDTLVELMELSSLALQRHQPPAYVADEARMLLARRLLGRRGEFELLEEHAGLCHALAQALRDGLAHGVERDLKAAQDLAGRAKAWERQADHLVMRARDRAERQPQWQPFSRLIESSDEVADALEEAAFVLSLIADGHHQHWGHEVRSSLRALADTVLAATQDHVRALAVAADLGNQSSAQDHDEYLDASWRVLTAERQCDELLRSTRRALAREVGNAAALLLGNQLAEALEAASDGLLSLGFGVREHALRRAGGPQ